MMISDMARLRLGAGALVALAATTLAFTSTQDADAQRRVDWRRTSVWAQNCQPQRNWLLSGRISTAMDNANIQRSRRDIGDPNADQTTLSQALASCSGERSRDGQRFIDAYLCVGEANLNPRFQTPNPARAHADAYCAYHAAAMLAEQARSNRLQSQAHIGRAKSLEALRASQEEILDAYQQAVNANRNAAEARVALARYYIGRGGPDLASARSLLLNRDGSANTGGSSDPHEVTSVALALVELAAKYDPVDRSLLSAAEGAARTSVAVNSALGAAYYELGRQYWPNAITYLSLATAEGQTAESGFESMQERAFLYRSMLAAGGTGYGTLREALTYANRAGSTPPALRQGCLVRLMLGGDQVFVPTQVDRNGRVTRPSPSSPINMVPATQLPGYEHCNRLASTAEGQLLLGMFWLRHAQYLAENDNPDAGRPGERPWSTAINNARAAFAQGERSLQRFDTPLDWYAPADERVDARTIRLRDMLIYGRDLAGYVSTICRRFDPGPSPGGEERIFEYYKVIRPRGDLTRCIVAM